jgi:hypothetical protein
MKEENRQRVFKNGVLGMIVGPNRNEVERACRRLHNEQLYDLYSATNIIQFIKSRRMRCEHVACTGDRRSAKRFWVGKPDKIIPLGRPRSRWNNDIKMSLKTEQ